MDKIVFLNELCTISDVPAVNKDNFDKCMMFGKTVNVFYEALKQLSDRYVAHNEIVVAPIDFSKFTVPPGEFRFMFSKKVKSKIDCSQNVICEQGICVIRTNENEAGYIVSVSPHEGM